MNNIRRVQNINDQESHSINKLMDKIKYSLAHLKCWCSYVLHCWTGQSNELLPHIPDPPAGAWC